MQKPNFTLPFGKFRGVAITRVPPGYLKWSVQQHTAWAAQAAAELERRGHVEGQVEITAHAVNRASQRVLSQWLTSREAEEGLYTWMERKAAEALASAPEVGQDGRVTHEGITWVFALDMEIPVVKSVWLAGKPAEE